MKIRSEFVTNSSSVSYVLTMKEEIVKLFEGMYKEIGSEKAIVYRKLKEMIEQGEKIQVGSDVLLKTEVRFHTNDVISGDQVDFSTLNDEDLISYIYGEYILNGKIQNFYGIFGATLTDHF